MSFSIFQNKKTVFYAIKTRSLKSRRIDIFAKGLTHAFSRKMAIFPTFSIRQFRPGKCLLRCCRTKKQPFQVIKTRSLKNRKIDIFATFFFQAIYYRKMSFTIFQIEKTPFQAIKTKSSKSRKIDIFPKGLTHVFGPKMAFFPTFSIRQFRPGKFLLRYSRTKKRLSRR